MKIFGQIINTAVNTALLPKAVFDDVVNIAVGDLPTATGEALQRLKEEAQDPDHVLIVAQAMRELRGDK